MTTSVVIIASADRSVRLHRALRSLARQRRRPDRVVVVQLGSEPLTIEPDDLDLDVDVDVVSSPATEAGLALGAARNLGAASSTADHLIFLDVDCIAAADLVDRYVDVLDAHPGILACGPVRYLREGWDADGRGATSDTALLHPHSDAHASRPVPVQGFVEVNDHHELFWSLTFGVTRDTWTRLGGFDERFVGYGAEDTDLAFRARSIGVALAWFDNGTAYHQWHPPSRIDPGRTSEIVANARRFHDRWGTWPMSGWLRELDELGRIEFDEGHDVLRVVGS